MLHYLFNVDAIYTAGDEDAIAELENGIRDAFVPVGWTGTKDVSTAVKKFRYSHDADTINENYFQLEIDRGTTGRAKIELIYHDTAGNDHSICTANTSGQVNIILDIFKLSKGGMTFRLGTVADGTTIGSAMPFWIIAFKEGNSWRYIAADMFGSTGHKAMWLDDGEGSIQALTSAGSSKSGLPMGGINNGTFIFVPFITEEHGKYDADIFVEITTIKGQSSYVIGAVTGVFEFYYNKEKYLRAIYPFNDTSTGGSYGRPIILKLAEEE